MQTILPIFIIILLGAFFFRIKLAKYLWIDILNEFVVKVGFPSLIFSTLVKLQWNVELHGRILLVNSLFVLFCFLFALIISHILKFSNKLKRTLFLAAAYGNIAYLGIPIIEVLLGKEYLPEASLITACYLFWIFTVGIIYLEYSKSGVFNIQSAFLNLLKNPIIIAVFAGVVMLAFQVQLPAIVLKPLEMISASVTPVILFSLGIFLGNSSFGKLKEWSFVFFLTVFVLVLKPFLFYLAVTIFNLEIADFHVSILDAGMPLALTPFALSKEFDLDADFLARGIVLSTILSIVTLTLLHSSLSGL